MSDITTATSLGAVEIEKETKGMFVRISLQNIKFEDPYEQFKFEKMKSADPDRAIDYLESIMDGFVLTISFNQ